MKHLTNMWGHSEPLIKTTKRTSTLSDGTQVGYLLKGSGYYPAFVIGNNEQFFYGADNRLHWRAEEFSKKDKTKILNGWRKFCKYYEKEGLKDEEK